MRKIILVIIMTILVLNCCQISFASNNITVVIDGSVVNFDVPPCIVGDRVFVPVRGLLDRIGADVDWDEQNKMIFITNDGISAWFQVNNTAATYVKNGEVHVYHLNAPPHITNDRIFVPIRAISDIFDVSINWDAYSKTVSITTSSFVQPEIRAIHNSSQRVYTDTINLTGFIAPQQVNVGQAFVLYGEISSNILPLNRVNVKIIDKATLNIEINETQFDIAEPVYPLSEIDGRVKFGTLSVGQKYMEITAVDQYEQRRTFSFDFEVKRPGGVALGASMEMLWPVPSSGLITTVFWCDNVFCHSNGGRPNGHAAIDIAANENADVISVQDGIVRDCGFGDGSNGHSGYGNYIEVDHGNGIITQYAHLYSIYVTPGQAVSAGQVIGGVGNTGNSTGNHLDFSIESNGQRCDPLYYLNIPADARCYEACDKIYFDKAMQARGIVR